MTIRLGLQHVFLFPSRICHLSRKHEAGRPFGLRKTLNLYISREGVIDHDSENTGTHQKNVNNSTCAAGCLRGLVSVFFCRTDNTRHPTQEYSAIKHRAYNKSIHHRS